MTPGEQHDLDYHNKCRKVADALNLILIGSTFGDGFNTITGREIDHLCVELIHTLTEKVEELEHQTEACKSIGLSGRLVAVEIVDELARNIRAVEIERDTILEREEKHDKWQDRIINEMKDERDAALEREAFWNGEGQEKNTDPIWIEYRLLCDQQMDDKRPNLNEAENDRLCYLAQKIRNESDPQWWRNEYMPKLNDCLKRLSLASGELDVLRNKNDELRRLVEEYELCSSDIVVEKCRANVIAVAKLVEANDGS